MANLGERAGETREESWTNVCREFVSPGEAIGDEVSVMRWILSSGLNGIEGVIYSRDSIAGVGWRMISRIGCCEMLISFGSFAGGLGEVLEE